MTLIAITAIVVCLGVWIIVKMRRKRAGLKLICSGCGQYVPASKIQEISEREVRDLPCFE